MPKSACPSCGAELSGEFRFCTNCGHELQARLVCPNCGYHNKSDHNFCQECGTPLHGAANARTQAESGAPEPSVSAFEVEPPPQSGITIEFPHSSAKSFSFAVKSARKFPSFRQYGKDKEAIYRVTFQPNEMDSASQLLVRLKGCESRTVYVDGQEVTWESVFSFARCYERRKASSKPEIYCFGYENDCEFNLWGCIQAYLPFTENGEWFCWGTWVNGEGDWKFDKDRIRKELLEALYPYRLCPALQQGLAEDVLNALPDVVNPSKNSDWKYVESASADGSPGLVVILDPLGTQERAMMRGVCPNGQGAITELAERIRFRLPFER